MGLEGELMIGLHLRQARVHAVDIRSTRADVAGLMLQGRTRSDISTAVPLLFSICGRSQAVASELACSAADGGAELTSDDVDRCRAAVASEMLREGAWRTLLQWPQWMGEQPGVSDIAAARTAQLPTPAAFGAIAHAVFGTPAEVWLRITTMDALMRWADAGQTCAARFISGVRNETASTRSEGVAPVSPVPLLPNHDHAQWVAGIALAADADADFTRHPTINNQAAETGALSRLHNQPTVTALLEKPGLRVLARFVAQLHELALLLLGQGQPKIGAIRVPGGIGVGWVDTARGLLIHQTRWQHGRAARYRIIAPTEWNFHPQGALTRALAGATAANPAQLQHTANRLVQSLDPCVAFKLELHGA